MTIYSTMWGLPPDVQVADRREHGLRGSVRMLLRSVRPGDAILLNGALGFADRYADQLLAIVLRYRRPAVALVVADATWAPRSTSGEARHPLLARLVEAWNKLLVRLMDGPRTHFCFLAPSECTQAVAEARIDPSRVHFTPFCTTVWGQDRLERLERIAAEPGDFVFSGGNASRDYRLLLDAVEGLGVPVRLATSRDVGSLPPNVQAGPVSPDEFLDLMAASRAVVLPLSTATGRSGGQQSYLNALLLGRPLVVTDAPGVRDYLADGVHALVVPAEAEKVRRTLQWVLDADNAEQVRVMVERGRELARRLSPARYHAHLVEIARRAAGESLRHAGQRVVPPRVTA
jgi:glycosyltransferase involved in cell wall biosynthesis